MSKTFLEPVELRSRGFDALVDALGWSNAVRFIQQYETTRFDYTEERRGILPAWSPEELVGRLQALETGNQSENRED